MNEADFINAARAMANGGSFAAAISDAYFAADQSNKNLLTTAFYPLFEKFNPENTAKLNTELLSRILISFLSRIHPKYIGDIHSAESAAWGAALNLSTNAQILAGMKAEKVIRDVMAQMRPHDQAHISALITRITNASNNA
jgi:hypothetical protein